MNTRTIICAALLLVPGALLTVAQDYVSGAPKSTPTPLYMVITLTARDGKEADLQKELLKVAQLSRKEPACIEYKLFRSIEKPSEFTLHEQWTSREEYAKQFEKDYIIVLSGTMEELLSKPYECKIIP